MTSSHSQAPVIVTGAAGFIGYHLAERLLAADFNVLGIDNLSDYYDVQLKEARLDRLRGRDGFAFTRLDLSDHDGILRTFEVVRPDYVINLAAQVGVRYSLQNPRAYVASNVEGFLSVLEACRHVGVRHLIYASSSSVYGANAKTPFSEHDPADHPVSLYAATKRANELMAHTYAHLSAVPSTGLRFFTVYGPWGRPNMAYFTFTKALVEGRAIDVYNNGEMRRDFTYIDDVTEAILRLLDHAPKPQGGLCAREPSPALADAPHRVFNIGNNTPIELHRFICIIEAAVGRTTKKRFLPVQPGDVLATYADVTDISAAVGFAPRTPIELGIQRFVDWYRDFYRV